MASVTRLKANPVPCQPEKRVSEKISGLVNTLAAAQRLAPLLELSPVEEKEQQSAQVQELQPVPALRF
jgi:hypothetical protein